MDNKLITLEKENFFIKVRKFFYNLFHKKSNNNISKINKKEEILNKNKFIENIKTDVNFSEVTNGLKREEFLKNIEKDKTILYTLPLDRLKVLERFYEDRINKKKEILEKIKINNS